MTVQRFVEKLAEVEVRMEELEMDISGWDIVVKDFTAIVGGTVGEERFRIKKVGAIAPITLDTAAHVVYINASELF
jgi:hypothetical protein